MSYLFVIIGWVIGVSAGVLFLIQPMIVLFFGIPTTLKMKNQGVITNSYRIVGRYIVSFLILSGLLSTTIWLLKSFFPNLILGFWIGIGVAALIGLNKIRKSHNMTEYIENNLLSIDTIFLINYIQSVNENHPSSKARDNHINFVTQYVVGDLKSMEQQVNENNDHKLYEVYYDIVTITMRLYKDELDEHWSETVAVLAANWDIKNLEEYVIQKEVFIALVTLELTVLASLFQEHAPIIRCGVVNYLINMYGNKEHIETLVNDVYYPAAERAFESFTADAIFNSTICNRLKQPISDEVILTISKLYGHMTGKWYVVKGIMSESTNQNETA